MILSNRYLKPYFDLFHIIVIEEPHGMNEGNNYPVETRELDLQKQTIQKLSHTYYCSVAVHCTTPLESNKVVCYITFHQ